MKTKICTSIEQSKILAKILPLETADMHYCLEKRDVATDYEIGVTPFIKVKRFEGKGNIVNIQPAWSLTALLGVLPNGIIMNKDSQNGKYHFSSMYIGTYVTADNPVDACYEMILKLNELNLL